MQLSLIFISLFGLALSFYAYLIERTLAKNPTYKPVCDISDKMSCTAPIKSTYSKLLSLSNAVWGMLFYTTIILMALLHMKQAALLITTIGIIYSIYLAYILAFKIRSWCLICTSLYIIDITLFVLSLLWYLY